MSTTPYDSPYSNWSGGSSAAFTRLQALGLSLAAVGLIVTALVATGPRTTEVTLPKGTVITAALTRTLSTENAEIGQSIQLRTAAPVSVAGNRTLPEGVVIRGDVIHVKGGGRIAGAPELTLGFSSLTVGGREYAIMADAFGVRGKNDAAESAAEIGGGAVVGGVVGAITGHTLPGVAVGAILGTGVAVATEGHQIVLPAGQKLKVRLAEPVTVRYRNEPSRTS